MFRNFRKSVWTQYEEELSNSELIEDKEPAWVGNERLLTRWKCWRATVCSAGEGIIASDESLPLECSDCHLWTISIRILCDACRAMGLSSALVPCIATCGSPICLLKTIPWIPPNPWHMLQRMLHGASQAWEFQSAWALRLRSVFRFWPSDPLIIY